MSQIQLLGILKEYLKGKYQRVIANEDYIIAEGDIPVAVVAHLDTVGRMLPNEIFYDAEERVLWSPQLLGADDRAGVYAIIKMISDGYRPHVIFTTNEEKGGIGASALVKVYPKCPFKDLKMIIEIDRHGKNDCVFYSCDNPEFTSFVEGFGFKEQFGTFSDISIIAPAWGIAAANLSSGYYNEHSTSEYLKEEELDETIYKVEDILDYYNQDEDAKEFKYIPAKQEYGYDNFVWNKNSCVFCGIKLNNKNKRHFEGKDDYGLYSYNTCKKCAVDIGY